MLNALAFVSYVARIGEFKGRLLSSFVATGFYAAAMVAQPFLIGFIVRKMVEHSTGDVHVGVAALAASMAISTAMAYTVTELNNLVLQDIRCSSKFVLYGCVLAKPSEFFRSKNEAWIEAAIATASQAARSIVFDGLNALVRALFFIVFSTLLVFFEATDIRSYFRCCRSFVLLFGLPLGTNFIETRCRCSGFHGRCVQASRRHIF